MVKLGKKDLARRRPTGRSFARVTVASVAKNLLSVSSLLKTGHEIVFSSGKSYIRHLKTDARQPIVEKNGVFELRPLSVRCGVEAPAMRAMRQQFTTVGGFFLPGRTRNCRMS